MSMTVDPYYIPNYNLGGSGLSPVDTQQEGYAGGAFLGLTGRPVETTAPATYVPTTQPQEQQTGTFTIDGKEVGFEEAVDTLYKPENQEILAMLNGDGAEGFDFSSIPNSAYSAFTTQTGADPNSREFIPVTDAIHDWRI